VLDEGCYPVSVREEPAGVVGGLGHHFLEPLQKGFPLRLCRAFRAVVNEIDPLLRLTLPCGICKLTRLNYRGIKIKVTCMQTQKLYHLSRQQPVLKTSFQSYIPLFWGSGRPSLLCKVCRACSKSGIVSLLLGA